jgi:chemotaxis methyl-accepting protein methylase
MAQLDSGHEGLSKKNFRTYSKLYRDPELFEAVEDEVLWELGKYATQNGQSAIEAWSVGCSAGEEVFSLLMSWEQALAPHMDPALKLRFYGTDLSDQAVDAARRAEYCAHAVQDVPDSWLRSCFTEHKQDDGQACFTVKGRVRQHAAFVHQDMREELPRHIAQGKKFDLVTCRYSVFLYCNKEECVAFLRDLVTKCLRPGGFLFIGAPDELPQGGRSGCRSFVGTRVCTVSATTRSSCSRAILAF